MKVMLVEDDELVRAILAEGLEDAGLQVADFSDPREALRRLETIAPPDVVVTDVDLGSTMNGFDVAIAAHNRWPSVRVILISGLPAGHTEQRLTNAIGISRSRLPTHACYGQSRNWRRRHRQLLAGLGSKRVGVFLLWEQRNSGRSILARNAVTPNGSSLNGRPRDQATASEPPHRHVIPHHLPIVSQVVRPKPTQRRSASVRHLP
jgi:CheY-like chemotaxis protein